jgi:hypothetical protein
VHTLPDVTFLVMKVTSVVPAGPGPTSQICVSKASPGFTGAVNLTPKNFNVEGSLLPKVLMMARAANPNVESP